VETSHQFRRWKKEKPPSRILAVRFQALGDTVITLPYLYNLKTKYPAVRIDLLTRKEVAAIPSHLPIFDRVIAIGGKRNVKLQILSLMSVLPFLLFRRYELVVDLQHNKISRLVRKLLFASAWSEFDNTSPVSAGIRTQNTINISFNWNVRLQPIEGFNTDEPLALLRRHGFAPGNKLVVLNPAGYCASRNWPIENYISFATLWLAEFPKTQFVLLLLPHLEEKAKRIASALGNACIDLTGNADQWDAFGIISLSHLIVSEDSGLMHMSWVQGIPTIALFSSSRKEWAAPQGGGSYCFDSSDLPCGPCQLEVCKFGDNRCLTRITPERVMSKCRELIQIKSTDLIVSV